MIKTLGIVSDVFLNPALGMEKASNNSFKNSSIFFFIFLLLIYVPIVKFIIPEVSNNILALLFALEFILGIFFISFWAFFVHGSISFCFKREGEVKKLISCFIFSFLPYAFFPFFTLFPNSNIPLISLFFFLWTLYLMVIAIDELYLIGFWKSFSVLITPLILIFSFSVFIVIYCGLFFIEILTSYF